MTSTAARSRIQQFLSRRSASLSVHVHPGLEIAVIHNQRVLTLQPAGELDYNNAGALFDLVQDLATSGAKSVTVDVSRLTFCDCAGLRAIVQSHNELLYHGGRLTLTGTALWMRRLLEITHLDEALAVDDEGGRRTARLHLVPTDQQ